MSGDSKQKQYWESAGSLQVMARRVRLAPIAWLLGVVALATTMTIPVQAQGNQRPLADFTSAQGASMCFTPPARDQLGWGTGINKTNGNANLTPPRFALIDYTGLEAKYLLSQGIDLGTTVSGSVLERPLADGRALVTVDLQTKNALGWALGPDDQLNTGPTLFGSRVLDIVNKGAIPALGDSHFHAVFINTAPGAPLPDLVCINASQPSSCFISACPTGFELDFLSEQASITGPLHAPDFPEGAPGRLTVVQRGLIQPAIQNGFKGPLSDAAPVESIALQRIGQ